MHARCVHPQQIEEVEAASVDVGEASESTDRWGRCGFVRAACVRVRRGLSSGLDDRLRPLLSEVCLALGCSSDGCVIVVAGNIQIYGVDLFKHTTLSQMQCRDVISVAETAEQEVAVTFSDPTAVSEEADVAPVVEVIRESDITRFCSGCCQ